jgi:nucleoside-diphosphate-sugar epimerase
MGEKLNHAIVFGASGLIGWAVVDQLLRVYPGQGSFSKITAVTNRPLVLSDTHWPELDSERPKLQLVSGIDLRRDDGAVLADSLKQAVEDIQTITHVYYLGRYMSAWQRRCAQTLTVQSLYCDGGRYRGGCDESTHVSECHRCP